MSDLPIILSSADQLALERSVYRDSLYQFVKHAWPVIDRARFKPNWHIEAICEHLQAQTEGDIQNLIINVPPGSAKSLIAGVFWPCWEWARDPSIQVLASAREEGLAKRDNIRARELLQSPWYQERFPLALKSDTNNALKFSNEGGGHREASVMSGLTGKRGNRLIIDDAISASEAQSDALRERVNEKWWMNAPSRVNEPLRDTTTVIQQRLHLEDLVGSILAVEPEEWEKLIIPMEYVPTTYVTSIGWSDPRTEKGELLFPTHWDEKVIRRLKNQGAYKYASQYQQNPVPDGDRFFDETAFRRYKPAERPAALTLYMTSDHAKGTPTGDYSVFRIWGVDEHKNFWLIASHRTRDPFIQALGIVTDPSGKLTAGEIGALALIRRHRPVKWFAEQDNIMSPILPMVVTAIRSAGLHCPIKEVPHKGVGKEDRAQPYQAAANLSKVYLPEGALGDIALAEYATFLVSGRDDQVDADAILPRIIDQTWAAIVPPAPQKKQRDAYQSINDNEGRSDTWGMFF